MSLAVSLLLDKCSFSLNLSSVGSKELCVSCCLLPVCCFSSPLPSLRLVPLGFHGSLAHHHIPPGLGEAHLDGGGKTKEIGLYNTERDTSAPFNCAGEHILTLSVNCKDERCPLLLELASYFLLLVKGNCVAPFSLLPL